MEHHDSESTEGRVHLLQEPRRCFNCAISFSLTGSKPIFILRHMMDPLPQDNREDIVFCCFFFVLSLPRDYQYSHNMKTSKAVRGQTSDED